jgi:transcription elongation factor Elf1
MKEDLDKYIEIPKDTIEKCPKCGNKVERFIPHIESRGWSKCKNCGWSDKCEWEIK